MFQNPFRIANSFCLMKDRYSNMIVITINFNSTRASYNKTEFMSVIAKDL